MIRNIIEPVVFYCQLAWRKHERESVNRDLDRAYQRATSEDERNDIYSARHRESEAAQHAVQALQTGYYQQMADLKGIATPQGEGDWEENVNAPGTRIMTVKAIARLRSNIREENEELRHTWLAIAAFGISVLALGFFFMKYMKPTAPSAPTPTPTVQPSPTPTIQPSPTPIALDTPKQKATKHGKHRRRRSAKRKRNV